MTSQILGSENSDDSPPDTDSAVDVNENLNLLFISLKKQIVTGNHKNVAEKHRTELLLQNRETRRIDNDSEKRNRVRRDPAL